METFDANLTPPERAEILLERHGATRMEVESGAFRVDMFVRMLAEIAHASATAQFGYGTFRPLLLGIIKGTSNDLDQLVGGSALDFPRKDGLHQLQSNSISCADGLLIVVSIRLFCCLSFPAYYCIAGEVTPRPSGESDGRNKKVSDQQTVEASLPIVQAFPGWGFRVRIEPVHIPVQPAGQLCRSLPRTEPIGRPGNAGGLRKGIWSCNGLGHGVAYATPENLPHQRIALACRDCGLDTGLVASTI